MRDVIVIGGGLAGLISAHELARAGLDVLLIEKQIYPFHKVCGEYISNEVAPFLKSISLFPSEFDPPQINRFRLTSVNGGRGSLNLGLGGFGISRYSLDSFLYNRAEKKGVQFLLSTAVREVRFVENTFEVVDSKGVTTEAKVVIGAHGKRDRLDRELQRDFIAKPSPYIAVKYHVKYDTPRDLISLHNFKGGYCGISHVENDRQNLCYLSERANLKESGGIEALEQEVLSQNPFLRDIFENAEFLLDAPKVINEVSFATKSPIENHILMTGDSAGMITPLCGNGMAMAIHSAKLLSESIMDFFGKDERRQELESSYSQAWQAQFSRRLWIGRRIQGLFGGIHSSNLAVSIVKNLKPVARYLVNKTHGQPF